MSVCVLLHSSPSPPGCPPCWKPFRISPPSPVYLFSIGLWVQLRVRSWKKFLARRTSSWNVTEWLHPPQRQQVNDQRFSHFGNYVFPSYWSCKSRCYWEWRVDRKAFSYFVLSVLNPFLFYVFQDYYLTNDHIKIRGCFISIALKLITIVNIVAQSIWTDSFKWSNHCYILVSFLIYIKKRLF